MEQDRKIFTHICRCICYIFILASLLKSPLFLLRGSITAAFPAAKSPPVMQVLLIPLDSRPPCSDFPAQLAQIAQINVMLPPPGYLDYYRQPSDTQSLAHWLTVVGPSADAVILSVDQLVHGGLLASRLSAGEGSKAEKVLTLLEQFHLQNPHIPIYAFNIIPRLLLADTTDNKPFVQDMTAYSILTDKLSLEGGIEVQTQLEQLESIIPPAIRHRYEDMYAANLWLGQRLMSLAAKGVLHHLVFGQDDAYPYGMANMTKRSLEIWLKEHPHTGNITITRGTDEIAATLIARFVVEQSRLKPRIYVKYSWPGAAQIIMPYMPNTVEQTVAEKIALAKGIQVQSPQDADFILYIHIGTPHTAPIVLKHAVDEVKQYLHDGHAVSLVDLSETYDMRKNLFPHLEKSKLALRNLISYNGWNTASNSLGTAVAHAVIYLYGRQNDILAEEKHYAYLFQRFLDDWYYQKLVQPKLNAVLTRRGISPVSLGEHYATANWFAQKQLTYYASNLYRRYFKHHSFGKGRINQFQCRIQLPWPRTFEIQLDVSFTFNNT